VLKFLEEEESNFGGTGRYYVCFEHPQFDLSSASDRAALRSIHVELAALPFDMHPAWPEEQEEEQQQEEQQQEEKAASIPSFKTLNDGLRLGAQEREKEH
jgi:hypothetical protein